MDSTDYHLAVGLWQWDHAETGATTSDYLNQQPTMKVYDYMAIKWLQSHNRDGAYDLHDISWANKATCVSLEMGPGYVPGDFVWAVKDSNNRQSDRFLMDPQEAPTPNGDHPNLLFYTIRNMGFAAHELAGLIFSV